MDEKLNIQDLSALLANQCGMEKEKAENFVKEFFSLIIETLESDKYVKIKGLGVFKLMEVEPRESINIQTKERFEIPGYTKVSFTPDVSLKETINQPFALFETVVLNENTVFDDKKDESTESIGIQKESAEEPDDTQNAVAAFSIADEPEISKVGQRTLEEKSVSAEPLSESPREKHSSKHCTCKRLELVEFFFLLALSAVVGLLLYIIV